MQESFISDNDAERILNENCEQRGERTAFINQSIKFFYNYQQKQENITDKEQILQISIFTTLAITLLGLAVGGLIDLFILNIILLTFSSLLFFWYVGFIIIKKYNKSTIEKEGK